MKTAQDVLQHMSLEEKIYQMVCVRSANHMDTIMELAEQGILGCLDTGVIKKYASDEVNKFIATCNLLYEQSPNLWLLMPGEKGLANYYRFGTSFPTLMALGATRSEDLAYRMANAIAMETRAFGATVSASLILDINTNPKNPIINTRSFSDRTELVIKLACAYHRGTQDANIVGVGYHFPGHGDTQCDSHITLPTVSHNKEFLMQRELAPYRALISENLESVCTAHILYPSLLGPFEKNIPATLSHHIITKLLKKEMQFRGLVISDSLTMKSVSDYYTTGDLAVRTIQSGHDILLSDYSKDPRETAEAIVKAIHAGLITIERIDESVIKILRMREKTGTLENIPLDQDTVMRVLNSSVHKQVAHEVATQSITVLEKDHIPDPHAADKSILIIGVHDVSRNVSTEDMGTVIKGKNKVIFETCKRYANNVTVHLVHPDPQKNERIHTLDIAKKYDRVIFPALTHVKSYDESGITLSDGLLHLINALAKRNDRFILINFGSPYMIDSLDRMPNCLCAYSDCDYSIDAAFRVIFGKIKAVGKLPVKISDRYDYGTGLS